MRRSVLAAFAALVALASFACADDDPSQPRADGADAGDGSIDASPPLDSSTPRDAAWPSDGSGGDAGDGAVGLCPDGSLRCDDFERGDVAGPWTLSALEGALLSIDQTKANTGTRSLRVDVASADDARAYLKWPASGSAGYQALLEAHFSMRIETPLEGFVDVAAFEFAAGTRVAVMATPNAVNVCEVAASASGNGSRSCSASVNPAPSAWHRFALVFDRQAKTARIDVDGGSQTITLALAIAHSTFDHVRIGAAFAAPQSSTLWIDDVALRMK